MSVEARKVVLPVAREAVARHVGGCREEMPNGDKCWRTAEFVLWGKLIKPEGLGPRCYDHAAHHVGHHALASRSSHALINLNDLAFDVLDAVL